MNHLQAHEGLLFVSSYVEIDAVGSLARVPKSGEQKAEGIRGWRNNYSRS